MELAFPDRAAEREEELLEPGVRLEEFLAGKSGGVDEMTWDKIGQDQPVVRG